ncbi:hypothetical protein FOG50_01230 [Hanseniaspora uvarum]|uniref:54S ribosomal protein L16, mitochondrial n=1 Tax=Hanseniaspora uvarum TaxID=29833 RepID=A0A1E5RCL1_HANUV|nr:hypothetical protein FOG48_03685 [Hanseniaspora uvarum]KAF0277862.1 hypothetical protein FOG50_01230 [Hanseniaspora uvarum]OEJ84640.1 54S ribosomal protein L16, mitochondrial [Hanseniaspora uvarum]GMM41221.1 mitochondrial 54S ribosomal protein YmL47 [Hanseniaspora uvarum]
MNALFAKPGLFKNNLFTSLQAYRYMGRYDKKHGNRDKAQKGRVPLRHGGSIIGSTLTEGEFGLRLKSQGLRLEDKHFKTIEKMVMRYKRLNGIETVFRIQTNIPVYHKGNHTRMGKGKGSFSHWMVRVPTGRVLLEVKNAHAITANSYLTHINNILPGNWEIIEKDKYLPRISTTEVLTKQIPGQKVPAGLPESFKLKKEEIDVKSIVNNKTWRKYECRKLAESSVYSIFQTRR